MSHNSKYFTYTFASGATNAGTAQYVGNAARMWVYSSDTQTWNAGSGNATLQIRGAYKSGVTAFTYGSQTVATANSGIWSFDQVAGVPFVTIGFGTAVTGSATNTLILITADDS